MHRRHNPLPNLSAHVQHTLKTYGVGAEDLHEWMDFPVSLFGAGHRGFRHNLEFIPQGFIDKHGKEMCTNIILDHLVLDKKDQVTKYTRSSGNTIVVIDRGTTHIPDVFLYNLEITHPKHTESRRAEIPYIICPDIVLLYNPDRLDKLAENLEYLLAKVYHMDGNLDKVRELIDTTGEVVPAYSSPYLAADTTPEKVTHGKGKSVFSVHFRHPPVMGEIG